MSKHFTLFTWAVIALTLSSGVAVYAAESNVEHTTESPIADMALVDTPMMGVKPQEAPKQQVLPESNQPQTIADFVIHPLIALKPRVQGEPVGDGKQAEGTTTPAPWQLFGFNPAQSLGSSVSSLAGTVSGWLGNRIQFPGLIDTAVTESTTTTTTTTPRPDVVVRVQHRSTTRRPLIQIDNESRPHRFNDNNLYDSDEYDDNDYDDGYDYDFDRNHDRDHDNYDDEDDYGSDQDDDEDDDHNKDEEDEDEDENEEDERPVRKRRPSQSSSSKKKKSSQKKRGSNKDRNEKRKRPQEESEEEADDEDEEDYNDDDGEVEDDDDDSQNFYYNNNNQVSTKRSQNQQGFIQLSQQNLLNQIRQLTQGQTPAEVGNTIRKTSSTGSVNKRRPQATLIINRNGQTVYIAPELMEANNKVQQYPLYATPSMSSTKQRPVIGYPQPPLTVPLRRRGQPTQYITIPWSQLGISPPSQLVSVTDGIQSQPLILNIPQSALEAMQNPKPSRRKPAITAEAVPLLAEASIMDVFKPPQIPPARHPPSASKNSIKMSTSVTPVIISTKTTKQRIRPGTIVEKAPDMDTMSSQQDSEHSASGHEAENQFIVIGDDAEPGLGRQAFPIVGEGRRNQAFNPYFHLFQNRAFNVRRGRELQEGAEVAPMDAEMNHSDEVMAAEPESMSENQESAAEAVKEETPIMESMQTVAEPAKMEAAVEQESFVEPAKMEAPVEQESAKEEAPIMQNEESVAEPAKEQSSVVQSSEQLIPVQVITSDSENSEAVAAEAKPEEAKTE